MLDYFANSILLNAHYNNCRFYKGNAKYNIPAGYYTQYELTTKFVEAGGTSREAWFAHLRCVKTLRDAYIYSDHITTLIPGEE